MTVTENSGMFDESGGCMVRVTDSGGDFVRVTESEIVAW